MQNKKGLSDIVTNVLIILLVLVAIGIIWAFVGPTINKSAGALEGASDCLTVEMEATKCLINGGGYFNLTYGRKPGQGDVQEVKFLLKDSTGVTVINSTTVAADLIQPYETRVLNNVFFSGIGSSPTFDVAVVIKTNDPAGKLCPAHNQPVQCT